MWPKRVIARIEGGLGNQLFQYAAARSLADRLGCDLLFDLRSLKANADRPFQLDLYRIRGEVATNEQLTQLPSFKPGRWNRVRARASQAFPTCFSFSTYWPDSFSYDASFEKISRPCYLVGYWQTEKYFNKNRARLLQDIELRNPIPSNTPQLREIKSTHSVALHIRRGDYISNLAAAQFHGLCDLNYYYKSVEYLKGKHSNIHVFVFSDEPAWAKANLKLNVPTIFVDANPSDMGYIDMELMRHCKHHVIANSSFSWWGAWRCENVDQVVCAPEHWFADLKTDTADVIPERWHQIGQS